MTFFRLRQYVIHLLLVVAALTLGSLAWAQANTEPTAGAAALDGYDPVAYFKEGKPVRGRADFQVSHGGSTYYFASANDRSAFLANPDAYKPQYDGYCPIGLPRREAPWQSGEFRDHRRQTLPHRKQMWVDELKKDAPRYITQADAIWARIKSGG
ncbi:MAG: YHS domain-containing (seleno)protein [Gammaproteobacteria bacterium]